MGKDNDTDKQSQAAQGQTGSVAPEPRSFEEKGGPNAGGYHVDNFSRNDAEGATALGEDQAELLDEAGQPMRRAGASSVEATPNADERNADDGRSRKPA